jgi:hypothetical protein
MRNMQRSEDVVLAEAEQDVRELEQHVADQHIRVEELHAISRDDDEMKAREGLFILTDALEIARRRLQAERKARGEPVRIWTWADSR